MRCIQAGTAPQPVDSPRRKWILEFSKNNTDTNAIMDFFNARRGVEAFPVDMAGHSPGNSENMGGAAGPTPSDLRTTVEP